jgi:hypothetical protein
MARPKRGQRVPPPPTKDEWDLRYATKATDAKGKRTPRNR